jgi:large subunit ribosomal protein L7Ae
MPPKNQKGKKALPKAPLASKTSKKVASNPLFEKKPKNFAIGGDIQPKRDLTRYVRWPRYVRLQRQKRILLMRLKVPPSLNQFNNAMDKNQASQLLRLMSRYKPETKAEKKARLQAMAKDKVAGGKDSSKKPNFVKSGVNHVVQLVESKKAKLVVISHDVDPIELVCWLPALCRKKDIPYCIIKGKGRLGSVVHQKSTSCCAITSVKKEDQAELEALCKNFRAQFNDNVDHKRKWGGGIMGIKSQHVTQAREKKLMAEQQKKMGLLAGNAA